MSVNPEARFRELFEQAPVSLQILAADGRTVEVNQAWRDLWQIHADTPLLAYILGDYNILADAQLEAKGVLPWLRRAFAGESVEIPAIRYDTAQLGVPGPSRWVTARAHPLKDGEGRVLEVMLMHEDISARVEAENTLREGEERFRSLATATSQIIWTTDADGRVTSLSPSWTEFTGQDPQAWLSNAWAEVLHPDDRAVTARAWAEAVRSGSRFEVTYRLQRRDGIYRWMSVKGVPVRGRDGVLREWIGANTDIDDMVTAQATLAQQLERERRQSALLAKVANASRTLQSALSTRALAEALVNEVRDILEVHQAVVSLNVGERWEQSINAVSMSDKYAAYTDYAADPNARPDGSGIYAEVCRTNRPMRLTHAELLAHPAWRGFGADTARHPPMRGWLAVPLIARDGRNLGLIQASDKLEGEFGEGDEAILVQLASIAAIGFENAQLVAALQEQDRRKDEFLAMLAHELRNPLAPISAAAHVLGRTVGKETDAGRVRQCSDIILRQVGHMTVLMNDLLDMSRVTRGMVRLDNAPVDLDAVIDSAAEQVQPLVEQKQHLLVVRRPPPPARPMLVHGDRARLVQIVSNLLTNAAKYTPPGGHIVLSVAVDGRQARIAVADNGSGIERALLPHLFELFTQGSRTLDRSQGGLGLGLALVKSMTLLHGGTVHAHSDGPGRGSTFVVELPLLGGETAVLPGAAEPAPSGRAGGP